jgi:hypothetical protein
MNHYDEPIKNIEQWLDHIYNIFFHKCTMLLCLLLVTRTCAIIQSQNHFLEPNWHMLDFIHPILLCGITYQSPLEMLSIHKRILPWCNERQIYKTKHINTKIHVYNFTTIDVVETNLPSKYFQPSLYW